MGVRDSGLGELRLRIAELVINRKDAKNTKIIKSILSDLCDLSGEICGMGKMKLQMADLRLQISIKGNRHKGTKKSDEGLIPGIAD